MKQESIHPRSYFTPDKRSVKNTMKRKNPDITRRKIAQMEAHLEKHPSDSLTRLHIQKLKEAA